MATLRKPHIYLAAVAGQMLLNGAGQAQTFDVDVFRNSNGRKSIVLISVVGATESQEPAIESGTAFFVSSNGFALTAAHLFHKGRRIIPSQRIREVINGADHISGRVGSSGEPPRRFQLIDIDTERDIALIKLVDPLGQQEHLKICHQLPPTSDTLYAFGFTAGIGLMNPGGTRQGDLVERRYPVTIPINPGMSGGPVLNRNGRAFAMSLSGVRELQFQNFNYVLPLTAASAFLSTALAAEDCSTMVVSSSDAPTNDPALENYRALIDEADLAINRNPTDALDKYIEAEQIRKKGWEAQYGIARVHFQQGNYTLALKHATAAFSNKIPTDYNLLTAVGLSAEGSGLTLDALKAYTTIISNVASNRGIYKDSVFSAGQLLLKLALTSELGSDRSLYLQQSRAKFQEFVELQGQPSQFAYYHLACIAALNHDKPRAKAEIVRARQRLDEYRGSDKQKQISLLASRLAPAPVADSLPGEPVDCPALKEMVANDAERPKPVAQKPSRRQSSRVAPATTHGTTAPNIRHYNPRYYY